MASNLSVASTFLNRLAGLAEGNISDFTITCGERQWPVHRVILFAHSDILAKAVSRRFQEAEDREIDLSDDPESCVEALVTYLYTFKYKIPPTAQEPDAVFHAQMCILADKYDIGDLKQLTIKSFSKALETKETTNDDLARAAGYAWEVPIATDEIRDEIVRVALIRDDIFTGYGEGSDFEMEMLSHPELALAIAKAAKEGAVKIEVPEGSYMCTKCKVIPASKLTRTNLGFWCCLDCGIEKPPRWWQGRQQKP